MIKSETVWTGSTTLGLTQDFCDLVSIIIIIMLWSTNKKLSYSSGRLDSKAYWLGWIDFKTRTYVSVRKLGTYNTSAKPQLYIFLSIC